MREQIWITKFTQVTLGKTSIELYASTLAYPRQISFFFFFLAIRYELRSCGHKFIIGRPQLLIWNLTVWKTAWQIFTFCLHFKLCTWNSWIKLWPGLKTTPTFHTHLERDQIQDLWYTNSTLRRVAFKITCFPRTCMHFSMRQCTNFKDMTWGGFGHWIGPSAVLTCSQQRIWGETKLSCFNYDSILSSILRHANGTKYMNIWNIYDIYDLQWRTKYIVPAWSDIRL